MTTAQQEYATFRESFSKGLEAETRYKRIFIEAVDEGLSILGESAKQSTYFYLEKLYGIKRSDIPFKVEEFVEALRQIFSLGSKIILVEIMKRLHEKLELQQ
jgi:hypothetical protein